MVVEVGHRGGVGRLVVVVGGVGTGLMKTRDRRHRGGIRDRLLGDTLRGRRRGDEARGDLYDLMNR